MNYAGLPRGGDDGRTYVACIYHNAPEQPGSDTDLTVDQLTQAVNQGVFVGKPVLYEHDEHMKVGMIKGAWREGRDFYVELRLDQSEKGNMIHDLVKTHKTIGVSLSHWKDSGDIREVSICKKGMRPNTWIVNASQKSVRYEYLLDQIRSNH